MQSQYDRHVPLARPSRSNRAAPGWPGRGGEVREPLFVELDQIGGCVLQPRRRHLHRAPTGQQYSFPPARCAVQPGDCLGSRLACWACDSGRPCRFSACPPRLMSKEPAQPGQTTEHHVLHPDQNTREVTVLVSPEQSRGKRIAGHPGGSRLAGRVEVVPPLEHLSMMQGWTYLVIEEDVRRVDTEFVYLACVGGGGLAGDRV